MGTNIQPDTRLSFIPSTFLLLSPALSPRVPFVQELESDPKVLQAEFAVSDFLNNLSPFIHRLTVDVRKPRMSSMTLAVGPAA